MQLKDAWDAFRRQRHEESGTFTAFGVGCSFSDSDEEKDERAALMAEASLGRMNQRTLSRGRKDGDDGT